MIVHYLIGRSCLRRDVNLVDQPGIRMKRVLSWYSATLNLGPDPHTFETYILLVNRCSRDEPDIYFHEESVYLY